MLQQTQVATVIPYFEAFLRRFPTIAALARAPLDEVLHLWSGMGYYARARNLHRAAQQLVEQHGGEFPATLDVAMELPGIGRSTASAILALSRDARHPILDGNVKRVLARYFAVTETAGSTAAERKLWELAERCMPRERPAAYTQAIMDLGATVCVRQGPQCPVCPIADGCAARQQNRQQELPVPRVRRARRRVDSVMLIALRGGKVLLSRRPPTGIWGGLWALPEFPSTAAAESWCASCFTGPCVTLAPLAPLRHVFTHFDLDIQPLAVECSGIGRVAEADWSWYDPTAPAEVGLPAPVRILVAHATRLPSSAPTANPPRRAPSKSRATRPFR
jgi:A/G-specific adenine glycosylase